MSDCVDSLQCRSHVAVRDVQALACSNKPMSELLLHSRTGELVWERLCRQMWGSEFWRRVPVNNWRFTYLVAKGWAFSQQYSTGVVLSNYARVAARPPHVMGATVRVVDLCRVFTGPSQARVRSSPRRP